MYEAVEHETQTTEHITVNPSQCVWDRMQKCTTVIRQFYKNKLFASGVRKKPFLKEIHKMQCFQ